MKSFVYSVAMLFFLMICSFQLSISAAEVKYIDLEATTSSTWPNGRIAFFVAVYPSDTLGNDDISWQMEGHAVGDRLVRNPFGVTLVTGSSQELREVTITAIYNEDVQSSSTVTVRPFGGDDPYDRMSMMLNSGFFTPRLDDEETKKVEWAVFFNVPDGIYEIAIISESNAIFLEGSEIEHIPYLGAFMSLGTIEIVDEEAHIYIGYNTEGLYPFYWFDAMIFVWNGSYGDEDFFLLFDLITFSFRESDRVPMHLALPTWSGSMTTGSVANWQSVPPSYEEYESIVTFVPMMIAGPFVDTPVYWAAEGLVRGDRFDEETGRLHLGTSRRERTITVTATWIEDDNFYATESVFVSPNTISIVPLQTNYVFLREEFSEIPLRVWGFEDGTYHARVSVSGTQGGLNAFDRDATRDFDASRNSWSMFDGEIEIINGMAVLNVGFLDIVEGWHCNLAGEWFVLEFAILDPKLLDVNDFGMLSASVRLKYVTE